MFSISIYEEKIQTRKGLDSWNLQQNLNLEILQGSFFLSYTQNWYSPMALAHSHSNHPKQPTGSSQSCTAVQVLSEIPTGCGKVQLMAQAKKNIEL